MKINGSSQIRAKTVPIEALTDAAIEELSGSPFTVLATHPITTAVAEADLANSLGEAESNVGRSLEGTEKALLAVTLANGKNGFYLYSADNQSRYVNALEVFQYVGAQTVYVAVNEDATGNLSLSPAKLTYRQALAAATLDSIALKYPQSNGGNSGGGGGGSGAPESVTTFDLPPDTSPGQSGGFRVAGNGTEVKALAVYLNGLRQRAGYEYNVDSNDPQQPVVTFYAALSQDDIVTFDVVRGPDANSGQGG